MNQTNRDLIIALKSASHTCMQGILFLNKPSLHSKLYKNSDNIITIFHQSYKIRQRNIESNFNHRPFPLSPKQAPLCHENRFETKSVLWSRGAIKSVWEQTRLDFVTSDTFNTSLLHLLLLLCVLPGFICSSLWVIRPSTYYESNPRSELLLLLLHAAKQILTRIHFVLRLVSITASAAAAAAAAHTLLTIFRPQLQIRQTGIQECEWAISGSDDKIILLKNVRSTRKEDLLATSKLLRFLRMIVEF